MIAADLVCFQVCQLSSVNARNLIEYPRQTYSYGRHFASSCVRVCGYESTSKGIEADGRVTSVTHCPVGIDAERVARDT